MVKICLSAIVKNESKIIERYLDSAKFAIDYVCITDTGSSDNTVKLIESWGKKHDIPTKVCTEPWKNFGHNRTIALDNSMKEFPEADYLLLMDADMQLENHGFKKEDLKAESYLVDQYNDKIEYGNMRLVSTKIKWCYVGVTHEFITPKPGETLTDQTNLNTLKIYDIGDGGSKDTKFQRDEKLLREALKTIDPKDPLKDRYNFYLAQTYFDTNKYSKAIRYYNERLKGEGYFSEKWYSQFRIGLCLEGLNRWDEAESALLKAYQMMPSRCEPLVALVQHYTLTDKPEYHKADLFIPRLQEMRTEPNGDALFNYIHYKQYYIDYLTSIVAYYVGKKALGRKACERVLASPHTPLNIRERTQSNLSFYPETQRIIVD